MGNNDENKDIRYVVTQLKSKEKESELSKMKEEDDKVSKPTTIKNKFVTQGVTLEDELKSNLIGLMTLNQMKKTREQFYKEKEMKIISDSLYRDSDLTYFEEEIPLPSKKKQKRSLEHSEFKLKKPMLSFCMDDDDEVEEVQSVTISKKKIGKNPDADTSFLPDKDRDLKEKHERQRLINEWLEMNSKIKDESIVVTFLYWDGSGHRKFHHTKKGSTIEAFIQTVLPSLRDEFMDLKNALTENMMFIKEDLIIPHSLPVKICSRSWYERNKHIYPANLWKPFDPDKKPQKQAKQ